MLRMPFFLETFKDLILPGKANFRRTNVATKLKLTYVAHDPQDRIYRFPCMKINISVSSCNMTTNCYMGF
jgi:hypothetical protein